MLNNYGIAIKHHLAAKLLHIRAQVAEQLGGHPHQGSLMGDHSFVDRHLDNHYKLLFTQ